MNENAMAISDYRDSQNISPTVHTPHTETNRRSYSNVAKKTYPKKDQAIVMNADDSLKLADYVHCIARIVGSKSITFASRISNGRICLYLASKEIVDTLLASYTTVEINNVEVGIRRLIAPAKRIVLSNVPPFIPDEDIENSLKALGLALVSPVTFLRANIPGIEGDDCAHILSFRRQVFVALPTTNILETQTSFVLSCEDTQYRIFLSCDDMLCFLCRQRGHVANSCPGAVITSPIAPQHPEISLPVKRTLQSQSSTNDPVTDDDLPPEGESPSTQETDTQVKHVSRKDSAHRRKKLKQAPPSISPVPASSLNSLATIYESQSFPIPFLHFKSFLENSFGSPDPMAEARRVTDDPRSLLETMHRVYPFLPDRSLKYRFTRISKKIKDRLGLEGADTSSIASLTPHGSQMSLPEVEDTEDCLNVSQESY